MVIVDEFRLLQYFIILNITDARFARAI